MKHANGCAPAPTMLPALCCAKRCNIFTLQWFAEEGAAGAPAAPEENAISDHLSGPAAPAAEAVPADNADAGSKKTVFDFGEPDEKTKENSGTKSASGETPHSALHRKGPFDGAKQTAAPPAGGKTGSAAARAAEKIGQDAAAPKAVCAQTAEKNAAQAADDCSAQVADKNAARMAERDMAAQKYPATQAQLPEQAKAAEFEKLIRGEYKSQFAARVQKIINQRFRAEKLAAGGELSREAAGRLRDANGVKRADDAQDEKNTKSAGGLQDTNDAENAAARMDPGNAEGAADAQTAANKSRAADADGTARAMAENARAEASAAAIFRHWLAEGEAVKRTYPDFDFAREAKNPQFRTLLKAGVSMQKAYEAGHMDEILSSAMRYTAEKVAQSTAARVAERARRPAENGIVPHAGAVMKPDVSHLSRAERERMERRALHGEKISI